MKGNKFLLITLKVSPSDKIWPLRSSVKKHSYSKYYFEKWTLIINYYIYAENAFITSNNDWYK